MRLLIIIITFGFSIVSFSQDSARTYYNIAVEQTDMGNYDEAIANYNRAIELNRMFHEAFFSRGYVYFLQENYEEAIINYDRAIFLQPVKLYYYQRGLAYGKKGQHFVAIKDFNKAVKIDPDYVDALLQRGELFDLNNRKELALGDYKKVLELGLNEPRLYFEIGWIYNSLNMSDSALKFFAKSVILDKPSIAAYTAIGDIYANKNEYENAIETYSNAIANFPDYSDFYYKRATCKFHVDSLIDEACSDLKKAYELGHKIAEHDFGRRCTE